MVMQALFIGWRFFKKNRPIFNAHVAQQVEHFLGKEEVTGSSPVVGSTIRLNIKSVTVSSTPALRYNFLSR